MTSGGEKMKIKLDIKSIYEEIEVHVCNNSENQEVKELYRTIKSMVDYRLIAYKEDEKKIISCSEIIRIYTQNKKVYVTTISGEYRLRERLYELEQKIDTTQFIRISNSEIVNIKKMNKIDTSMTGTIHLYLDHDIETYVSRRYVRKIKEALGI